MSIDEIARVEYDSEPVEEMNNHKAKQFDSIMDNVSVEKVEAQYINANG